MATLLSFVRPQPQGWSNEEKAQFARIQKLLSDAGVIADVEHGLTDEGEPWCVLCSGTTGDVIIHVARIDGHYLFDSSVLPCTIKGRSLDDCAKRFIDDATVLAPRAQHGSKIMLHPSAMLAGVMLTIFLYLEAIGENSAQAKALLDLDGALEAGETGADAAAKTDTTPEAVAEADDDQSPLMVLKQMLQQIAEAKLESDRTGAQGNSAAQNWMSYLPTAAVAAAIAFAQDRTDTFTQSDALIASSDKLDLEVEQTGPLSDITEEAEAGLNDFEATTVIDGQDGKDAAGQTELAVVEAAIADIATAQTPDVTFRNYFDSVDEQAGPIAAAEEIIAEEDTFVFAQEGTPDPAEQTTDAPLRLAQFTEDTLSVSRLVSLMSESAIEIQNEIFYLGDFIEIVDRGGQIQTAQASPTTGLADIDLSLPETDTLNFASYEPDFDLASSQQIADQIRAFVKITGMLRFDTSDRDNQVVYDRSVIGLENEDNVVSRSFTLQDDSIFTFVGFNDELDLLFA